MRKITLTTLFVLLLITLVKAEKNEIESLEKYFKPVVFEGNWLFYIYPKTQTL